jgi:hypothetical protein
VRVKEEGGEIEGEHSPTHCGRVLLLVLLVLLLLALCSCCAAAPAGGGGAGAGRLLNATSPTNRCVRSASESSMVALKQPTIRTIAVIAEGVPERDTKALIAYARANNKVRV